jgi:hypothetical protein
MARKPPALARELLRNFPRRRTRSKRRRRRGNGGSGGESRAATTVARNGQRAEAEEVVEGVVEVTEDSSNGELPAKQQRADTEAPGPQAA